MQTHLQYFAVALECVFKCSTVQSTLGSGLARLTSPCDSPVRVPFVNDEDGDAPVSTEARLL